MRVSTDPTDPAYIDDRPRRAWCNDREIEGWIVADEFRRCVITPQKVHNGSVRIERLAAGEGGSPLTATPTEAPIHAGFSGVFEFRKEPPPPAEVAPAQAAPVAKPRVVFPTGTVAAVVAAEKASRTVPQIKAKRRR